MKTKFGANDVVSFARCSHTLDQHGVHALACSKHLHTRRHNMIRGHIAAFARAAGLYTQVEQVVDPQLAECIGAAAALSSDAPAAAHETLSPAAQSHDRASDNRQGRRPVQRADIHIVDLTGADIFIDVRVTQVPADSLPQQHLQMTATRKAAEYACTGVSPVIFSTDG
eukprot:3949244-Amphidinium_carterae.1